MNKIFFIIIAGVIVVLSLWLVVYFHKKKEGFQKNEKKCVPFDQCSCQPSTSCPTGVACIPKSEATIRIPTVDKSVIDNCTTYKANQNVPWNDIAKDWVAGGGAPEDCPAALIVASGETSCTDEGCASVKGGLWQVTSPDAPPLSGCEDGDYNNCCNVDYVRNHFYIDKSSQIGCFGTFSNDYNGVPDIVPQDHSGRGLGGTQYNWIGPFCHAGAFTCVPEDEWCHSTTQSGIDGDNWGGGSQWKGEGRGNDQIFPFPYYYYAKFLESAGNDPKCKTAGVDADCYCQQPLSGITPDATLQKCLNENIVQPAIAKATDICKQALS